ncbi:MAG: hypothetical protein IPH45_07250 [Bacteroidales bacterium]|nr:hypothetical protein [Bacteroidales bacterium]
MTDYSETAETCNFPSVTGQQLTVNSSSSGYASKELPFAFPFYGKSYTKVFPHVDGYLMFEDHPVPWPYIIYERTFFRIPAASLLIWVSHWFWKEVITMAFGTRKCR